jgi:hypothetical protein
LSADSLKPQKLGHNASTCRAVRAAFAPSALTGEAIANGIPMVAVTAHNAAQGWSRHRGADRTAAALSLAGVS